MNTKWLWLKVIVGIFVGVIVTISIALSASASVTIVYFRAIPGDEEITLQWETATELDNAGFFINRSDNIDGQYQRINSTIIPAEGDGLTGATYEFVDDDVINGQTYWYKLETIDFGQNSQFYDPVSAVPGSTPTPTPTEDTPTATVTKVASTTIPTPTKTPIPTSTSIIVPPSLTPPGGNPNPVQPTATNETNFPNQGTSTLEGGQIQNATSTLIPLPSLTIEFPDAESTQSVTDISQSMNSEEGSADSLFSNIEKLWPIALIVSLWIIVIALLLVLRRYIIK
jgi:hypothetical protein